MSDLVPFIEAEDDLAELLAELTITAPEGAADPTYPVGVLTYVPEAIEPPQVVIQPAEDWMTTDEVASTFNPEEWIAHLEVWAVVDLVDNQSAARELREVMASVMAAIGPSSWWVTAVGQPGPIHTSEWMNHGVRITVARYVTA